MKRKSRKSGQHRRCVKVFLTYKVVILKVYILIVVGLFMKIIIKGEHSLAGIRQAIFEQLCEAETRLGVHHSRGATLYIRPTNEFGANILPRTSNGTPIKCLYSTGPYRPITEEYKA